MDKNDEDPYVPHFITAKDMAIIENCTPTEAEGRFKRMRKRNNVPRGFKLLTDIYCNDRGTNPNAIGKFFTKRFVTVLLAAITIALTFVCCRIIIRNYFPELNNLIEKHFIQWDYTSPRHQEGYMWIKNKGTGRMDKVTIVVDRLDTIPAFFRDFEDSQK